MMYLMCIDTYGREKYYEVNPIQERKITGLIREHKIPATFTLNGNRIVSKEILGFTEQKPEVKKELGISSMADLRKWAQAQPWYQRSKAKASTPARKPIGQPARA